MQLNLYSKSYAVSYTHLDVYKRQALGITSKTGLLKTNSEELRVIEIKYVIKINLVFMQMNIVHSYFNVVN